ncbi:GAF domain-containing protein [Mucilaginibacter sp. 21P]|uniref:GAF domain-containing protein n=1 Tax=Mucilaginibacter sp. 21P TaxID=2778902 RepID=UPI001C56C2E6|nr:GAF domain-containing protein [Mucilaginibacter sp. 21P]QXV64060.1 GAF domain-containing protein [Mucilaginibacter sp. 21P]
MDKKKNYDSDFCGSLPLNHINVIQSYGYLLVVDSESLDVIQASENISELLDKPASDVVNTPLATYADTTAIVKLQERFGDTVKDKVPATFVIGGTKVQALVHFKPGYIILELEKPSVAAERSFANVFEEVKYAMAAIEQADTIENVSQVAVTELRKLTGFDGIMMYHFDPDWNGTVIAEDKVQDEGLENYMGHTFPASDVPKQARQLYLKNAYRLIPDRDFKPVRLYPVINPKTNTFIDLSDCNLRGVAAVHLEYLKNMNVQASMSFRVIHNGQLWGLIACHHLTPRYLSFELCSVCELISSVVSNKITTILYKENFEFEADLQKKQTNLIAQVYAEGDLLAGLLNDTELNLMDVLNAGGVAASIKGKLYKAGNTPDNDFLENMVLWLQSKNVNKLFVSDHLSSVYDEALPFADIASGALAIPVNSATGDYIVAFRPEVKQTIKWGGNPNKAINFEPDGKNYHPRNSFKLWQETVHNTSEPWKKEEIGIAENMRSFVYEFTTHNA